MKTYFSSSPWIFLKHTWTNNLLRCPHKVVSGYFMLLFLTFPFQFWIQNLLLPKPKVSYLSRPISFLKWLPIPWNILASLCTRVIGPISPPSMYLSPTRLLYSVPKNFFYLVLTPTRYVINFFFFLATNALTFWLR